MEPGQSTYVSSRTSPATGSNRQASSQPTADGPGVRADPYLPLPPAEASGCTGFGTASRSSPPARVRGRVRSRTIRVGLSAAGTFPHR